MKLKSLLTIASLAFTSAAFAQEAAEAPLQISGSVDTYYKYDFGKVSNLPTSFASDHNSVSIGMIDLALKKTTGKASFVGELSFGPRGQGQSLVPAGTESFHIQNLYVNYAFTDKFTMTAGFMGTFIGYEVISPAANFNYSTSYLFTNGPFQNAGIKATYAFSPKVSLMVGAFNDAWNTYTANPGFGVSTFGAQLMVSPVEGWTAYLNLATGYVSGTEVDLTTAYQVTEKFKLGLNVADWSAGLNADKTGFTGAAIYPQYAFSPAFALGLRGEYFKTKDNGGVLYGPLAGESVFAATISANVKAGGLTFIPEVRFDNGSATGIFNGGTTPTTFVKSSGAATKGAGQFSLAAVYAF
ncbi:porin [Pedobacter sp. PWIIR3]